MEKNGKLKKALANIAPKALDAVGNLSGVRLFNRLSDVIEGTPDISQEDKLELYRLMNEELAIEAGDRDSARKREVGLGRVDPMMMSTGITGLLSFIAIVAAVLFVPTVQDNKLFIHLMGIVEGVAMTIFAYYFGTSKSSKDKDDVIKRIY